MVCCTHVCIQDTSSHEPRLQAKLHCIFEKHSINYTFKRASKHNVLICTGIVKSAPFLEMSEADFDDVIAVNLKGVFLTCQAAAQQMVKQGISQT